MLRLLVLFLFALGCVEEHGEVYETKCPEVELGEHIGYLSIEGIDQEKIGYWGCIGESCSGTYVKEYGIRVSPMGDDTLKVCCGGRFGRVDQVNVVIIK